MFSTWLGATWGALVVRGVLAVIFGIIAVASPVATAIALALLWGIWALVDGITMITHVFTPSSPTGNRVLWGLMGLLALVAAFVAITRPGLTAVTLTWVLGIWLLVRRHRAGDGIPRLADRPARALRRQRAPRRDPRIPLRRQPRRRSSQRRLGARPAGHPVGIVFIVLGVMLRKEVREISAA